ncbi:hypothetical protein GOP47_0003185 [Adiantum capillus-veneris]|uniref:Uncharacterized protein n=1 Tax=Adiantum capillus-veneris TaxID=13818 RepID=A0A9D4VDH1_ADICA|nr:hypothetical protein GOP47_0003185 [Adiantum capillus-veneris]
MDLQTSALSSSSTKTSEDEESTTTNDNDNSLEIMGLILTNHNKVDPPDIQLQEGSMKSLELHQLEEAIGEQTRTVFTNKEWDYKVHSKEILKQVDVVATYWRSSFGNLDVEIVFERIVFNAFNLKNP